MIRINFIICVSLALIACKDVNYSSKLSPETVPTTGAIEEQTSLQSYSVIFGGSKVGEAKLDITETQEQIQYKVDFEFSNNGRGASSQESITTNVNGIVLNWQITGKTTFGNAVSESFTTAEGQASWTAAAGEGSTGFEQQSMYIAQNASPFAIYLYTKALLKNNSEMLNAIPAGKLSIKHIENLVLPGKQPDNLFFKTQIYAISGINLDPSYIVLDDDQQLLALISPRFAIIRKGAEQHDSKLRKLAAEYNVNRFKDIAKRVTHKFDKPLVIQNVRIFEPSNLSLSALKSVTIENQRITKVQAADAPISAQAFVIDGKNATLVAGLHEMHGHMSDNHALLNVMAGVTSVRDMGNEINVLDPLIENIESGVLIGPRITKSAFIEGKSPFSAATGELAASEEEAVALINFYAEQGNYFQVKVYSSINPEWVPAMVAEAKKHGMRIAGHIPAFSTADEMIKAGYNEITHINQVMLSWVLSPEEDTRTLFRITGMKRFTELDVSSPQVSKTLDAMVANNIAVDPTIVIHEFGLTARNGETRMGMKDYIDNMPIGVQRDSKLALLNVADEAEDTAYKQAFTKIIEVLSLMHKRGILIVPGTDLGGAFELHRELELFEKIGMKPAEVLKRATYDMAHYLGNESDLGSIEVGKLADFFMVEGDPTQQLKAIKRVSMVVKNGNVYFPSEVYPEFGITPFTEVPTVTDPK